MRPLQDLALPWIKLSFRSGNVRSHGEKRSLRPGNARLQKWRALERRSHGFPPTLTPETQRHHQKPTAQTLYTAFQSTSAKTGGCVSWGRCVSTRPESRTPLQSCGTALRIPLSTGIAGKTQTIRQYNVKNCYTFDRIASRSKDHNNWTPTNLTNTAFVVRFYVVVSCSKQTVHVQFETEPKSAITNVQRLTMLYLKSILIDTRWKSFIRQPQLLVRVDLS